MALRSFMEKILEQNIYTTNFSMNGETWILTLFADRFLGGQQHADNLFSMKMSDGQIWFQIL